MTVRVADSLLLSRILSERVGYSVRCTEQTDSEGVFHRIGILGLDEQDGFTVHLRSGLTNAWAEFVPGAFSKPLLLELGRASEQQRVLFRCLVEGAKLRNIEVDMSINRKKCEPTNFDTWQRDWSVLSLSVKLQARTSATGDNTGLFVSAGELILNMILSLLPVEHLTDESSTQTGYAEGYEHQVLETRHERNRLNRAACIQIHGVSCKVCGFDFEDVYGPLGTAYIHVHHLIPVSTIAPGTVVDPSKDLIPVCPNCHAMLHRRTPPVTPEALRSSLRRHYVAGPNDHNLPTRVAENSK